MTAFRKKPVVIEAWLASDLIRAAESCWADLPRSVARAYEGGGWLFCPDCLYIHTLEGSMRAERSDMVIRGVAGEFYPCRADIFAATYEPADRAATEAAAPPAPNAWLDAFDIARDAILHGRGALQGEGMSNDQTNAVLTELNDAFGALIEAASTLGTNIAKD
jgi:hypothetical protein